MKRSAPAITAQSSGFLLRPQLYDASYGAIVAGRVDDPPTGV